MHHLHQFHLRMSLSLFQELLNLVLNQICFVRQPLTWFGLTCEELQVYFIVLR